MVRWCWVNFQCRGVLYIWMIVGHGPTALAVGAGGGCSDIFSLVYHFSSSFSLTTARYRLKYCLKGPLNQKNQQSPSLWETARYRLKYCLKGPLSPKQPKTEFTYAVLKFQGHWTLGAGKKIKGV